MSQTLSQALSAVDWTGNVESFLKAPKRAEDLTSHCKRIGVFTHELSFQDFDNPAIPFLQEMKSAAFQVPACLSLGLIKPAAAMMRSMVECALYYSYFRQHPQELHTLIRNSKYYIGKSKIIEHHALHIPDYAKLSAKLHFESKLNDWYSEVSAIVHGQIPGVWTSKSLAETAPIPATQKGPIRLFERAVEIVQLTLLLSIGAEEWEGINPKSRVFLQKGLSAEQKAALNLSAI